METWLFYTLTTLLGLLCLLLLRARARSSAGGRGHAGAGDALPPLPPGPTPLPVVGPLLFLARRDFDFEPVLRRIAREHGPVFTYAPLGRALLPTVFVASCGAAHRALVQRGAAFASRPASSAVVNAGGIIFSPYGATWRALRRNLTAGVLNPSRLRAFSPTRRRVLSILASRFRAAGPGGERPVAVMEPFQHAMFRLLMCMCFGDRVEDARVQDIEATHQEHIASFHSFEVFSFLPALTKVLPLGGGGRSSSRYGGGRRSSSSRWFRRGGTPAPTVKGTVTWTPC